ncbi:MAG: HAMP domain-containing protein [Granulosicoccus sp.]
MARSSDSIFLISLLRDKTFQAREIRRVILLSLVYLAVTTVLVGVFYHQMLGTLLQGMAPLLFVSEDIAMANEALPTMSSVLGKWMLVMLGVNVLITSAVAIYITRKLGRPILAIKRALRDIGDGKLDVRLRSSDKNEFGEISTELTAAMHSIRLQISAAKESIAELETHQDQPSVLELAPEIDIALDNCRSALDFFQTSASDNELDLVDDDNNSKVA